MSRRGLIRNSTEEWRAIAKGADVLYSIASAEGKQGAWTEDDFYASGRSDWADFLSHWRHYEPGVGGTCVEIGCGAGRMTAALAGHFERVVALDVSDDMIDMARAHVPDTVTFHRVSGSEMPVPAGSIDAVFSVHVLQHLDDVDAIDRYLRAASAALRPGGTIMAHMMVSSAAPSPRVRLEAEARLLRSRLALARGRTHTAVRMVFPPVATALSMMRSAPFADVELRWFGVSSNGSPHSFFLGRRRG